MKSCWIFFVTFATSLALSSEDKQKLSSVLENCREIEEIDDVKQLRNQVDSKLKNYLFCIFTVMNWMDERGNLLLNKEECKDLLSNELSDNKKEEIINECNSLKGGTPQDTALLIYRCYWLLCENPSFCI